MQERFEGRLKTLAVGSSDAELAKREVDQYVRSCEQTVSASAMSTTCKSSPPPRRSMPSGLLAAGGHDVNWRSLRYPFLTPFFRALLQQTTAMLTWLSMRCEIMPLLCAGHQSSMTPLEICGSLAQRFQTPYHLQPIQALR